MSLSRRKAEIFRSLTALYERMDQEYAAVARAAGLSCQGCADNCCVSYFQHHTYVEWAFLWQGMRALDQARRDAYLERAAEHVRQSRALLSQGLRPRIMCPLNDDGACGLYSHRLMICRLHGTANRFTRPDGAVERYAGCFRFVELAQGLDQVPALDRTPLYMELARVEQAYMGRRARPLPRVDLTLAEMLMHGPPKLTGK